MKTPTSELIEKYRKQIQICQELIDNGERVSESNILIDLNLLFITDLEQADKEWREKHREDVSKSFKDSLRFTYLEDVSNAYTHRITFENYYNQKFGEDGE